MKVTRRSMLCGTAAISLAGCSTTQIQQTVQQIIDTIQAFEAATCGIIPTAQSILSVIAALGFSVAGIGAAALQAVEQAICSAVPPAGSAKFAEIPLTSGPPGVIGITHPGNVTVTGWRVR